HGGGGGGREGPRRGGREVRGRERERIAADRAADREPGERRDAVVIARGRKRRERRSPPSRARGDGGRHADPLRAHGVAVRILDLQRRLLGEWSAALRRARGRCGERELAGGGRGDVEGGAGAGREPRGRGGEGVAGARLINGKAGEARDAGDRRLRGGAGQRSSA